MIISVHDHSPRKLPNGAVISHPAMLHVWFRGEKLGYVQSIDLSERTAVIFPRNQNGRAQAQGGKLITRVVDATGWELRAAPGMFSKRGKLVYTV